MNHAITVRKTEMTDSRCRTPKRDRAAQTVKVARRDQGRGLLRDYMWTIGAMRASSS